MKPHIAFLVLSMAAVSAMAAPVPKELKTPADAERTQGVWTENGGSTRWFFDGKKLYAGGPNTTDNKGHEYDIALRPGEVNEFDLAVAGAIRFAGIYKFVGDDLHIAYNNGQVRPKDFAMGTHKPILKRLAEAKK